MTPYYEDESVTLYHGNCLEAGSLAWISADVLITDPPYGQSYQAGRWGHTNGATVVGDHDTSARDDALDAWGSRPALVFGNWRVQRPAQTVHRLLWHKAGRFAGIIGGNDRVPWFPVDEEIYILGRGWLGPPDANLYVTNENRSQAATKIGHPTPKPLRLMEQLVVKAPPGVIADPFAGSGSTLVAARNQGRKSIGVEIEERYCELIAKRLAQAVLI